MENRFSNKEMKRIVHEIVNGVSRETGIKINVYPVTVSEYYYNHIKKNNVSLVKKMQGMGTIFSRTLAFNDLKGNTVYFVDKINEMSNSIEKALFLVVHASYHEARHSIQQKFNPYSYEGFFRDIDTVLVNSVFGRVDYNINHDRFFVEIDANRYGIIRAEEYIRVRYPDLYRRYEKEIMKRKNKYELDYISFDPVNEVDRIMKALNTIEFPGGVGLIKSKDVSSVLDIFLDNRYKFKKVKDIIRDKRFYNLDERIVYSIFSSKSFLEQVDFTLLEYDELYVVSESLRKIRNYYENQARNMEEFDDDRDFIDKLKYMRGIIGKVGYTYNYITRMIYNNYGYVRNDKDMVGHRNNIGRYLNKTNNTMKRKYSKGFIFVDIIYIFSLFISVFVIVYLVVLR